MWVLIGFIPGLAFFPVKFWIQSKIYDFDGYSTCDTPPKEELIPKVKQGDTIAYNLLSIYFACSEYDEELLPYALLMANKYHYIRAYYDVYDCFCRFYPETTYSLVLLDSLDKTTRDIALEYLQKGADFGETNCEWNLGNYYNEGKYFEKDTVLGQKLKDKRWATNSSE
jgi:hypothetical protein